LNGRFHSDSFDNVPNRGLNKDGPNDGIKEAS
jgi:hypothetical protein